MRLATAFTESGNTRLANPIAFDSGDAATRWTSSGLRTSIWTGRTSTPAVASLSAAGVDRVVLRGDDQVIPVVGE